MPALSVGFISAFLGCSLGAVIGTISAFAGGKVDIIIQRFIDIMLSFPLEAAKATGQLGDKQNLSAFVDRVQARPAYRAALEKGGQYAYGPQT